MSKLTAKMVTMGVQTMGDADRQLVAVLGEPEHKIEGYPREQLFEWCRHVRERTIGGPERFDLSEGELARLLHWIHGDDLDTLAGLVDRRDCVRLRALLCVLDTPSVQPPFDAIEHLAALLGSYREQGLEDLDILTLDEVVAGTAHVSHEEVSAEATRRSRGRKRGSWR